MAKNLDPNPRIFNKPFNNSDLLAAIDELLNG